MTEKRNTCPVPQGKLVLVGGGEDRGRNGNEEKHADEGQRMKILEEFVRLLPKKGTVEVITSAVGDDPSTTFADYRKAFKKLGVNTVNHMHHDHREEVAEQDIERIGRADGVYLSGGTQLKLTALYGGTELFFRLKERYISEPIVVGGTSAGAMALSTPMIYEGVGRKEMMKGHVKITTGLEFLRDICIDTHFVERGRFVRMAQVLATNPGCIGLGIEADTALVVKRSRHAEVIGEGVVILINCRENKQSNIMESSEKLISIRNLQVDILGPGQKFEFPSFSPPHH